MSDTNRHDKALENIECLLDDGSGFPTECTGNINAALLRRYVEQNRRIESERDRLSIAQQNQCTDSSEVTTSVDYTLEDAIADLAWVPRINVAESAAVHARLVEYLTWLHARVSYLEADNQALFDVVFQAEDCVYNGCSHVGLEEAVNKYFGREEE